jgi:molybdenum cofactor biosynthesis protein MoaC
MVDITHKNTSLRRALAEATVAVSDLKTIFAVHTKSVPKGDVLEAARVAALFAVKRTHDMIPDCHPLPVESASVRFAVEELEIRIWVEVKTIYRTGVEVEAMHGASVAALTIYDMLKPIDKGIEIRNIRLVEKKGGKSDFKDKFREDLQAAIIVCSDTVAAGSKSDKAGKAVQEKIARHGVGCLAYTVIPDEVEAIQSEVLAQVAAGADMVLLCGGTGLSPRDVTPEAVRPLLDREIPGLMESARAYGQARMPWAMLSRGIAGMRGDTLIITLPGSTGGATETVDALFPWVLHVFRIVQAFRHD